MKKRLFRLAAMSLACMLPLTAAAETVTLPESLTVIEREAFAGDTSIDRVIVPEGTTSIGSRAFADSSLTEIELPESLTEIPDDMFDGCGDVTVVAYEDSKAYVWALANGYITPAELPESDHPYAPDSDVTWEYKHHAKAYALAVTFSTETQLEEGYDFLTLTDAEGSETEYTGAMLMDKTVVVKGNSFSLNLTSDGSGEEYGFRIEKIEALATEEDYNSYGGFTADVLEDGTLSITGYDGAATDVTISAEIDGVKVTQIAADAFRYSNLTSVTVENGIEVINESAFYGCEKLKSVVLPDSVKELGESCFRKCSSLQSVILSSGLSKLPENLFKGCIALEEAIIPEGVTVIEEEAFSNCHALKKLVIPEGVETIGEEAFYNCVSLPSIHIPASVTNISNAILCVTSDEFDQYPDGQLKEITVAEGNERYKAADGMLIDTEEKAVLAYAYGRTDETVTIPKDVSVIADSAFSCSAGLKSVTIPGTVKTIEYCAFAECLSLRSVVLENGVESIFDQTFMGCDSLTAATLPASVTAIGRDVFTEYYDSEASGFRVTVTAPAGSYAETWCVLNGVPLTSGTERVVSSDFVFTKSNNTLTLNEYTGEDVSIVIPASVDGVPVTAVGVRAFYSRDIESAVIPEGVTIIADSAFEDCENLTSVSLPDSLLTIGKSAFYYNTSLQNVTLPEGLKTIGGYAFARCFQLTQITIPESVAAIDNYAFSYCSNLAAVVVKGGETIGNGAFMGCSALTSVTLPDNLKSIGSWAFSDCSQLAGIYIPASVASIDESAFDGCHEDFTIYGVAGSFAEEFADDYGYPFLAGSIPA